MAPASTYSYGVEEGVMNASESLKTMMKRAAAVLLIAVAACAHDHALDRGQIRAVENSSPAISPWPGPVENPVSATDTAEVP
jgi:hypothetical protein